MSSLSQLNSMTSDWSCQQIHHLLLSTLPSDALDISELREPTFSKPSISFASLMQKRNQTTETQG